MAINSKPQRALHRQNGIMYAKKRDRQYPDSLDSVLCDWNMICIFFSFCLCDWEQNTSDKKQALTSADGLPLALIFPDLVFLGGRPVHYFPFIVVVTQR